MDRERYRPVVAVWNYRQDDVHVEPIRSLGVPLYWFPAGWSSAAKLRAFRRLVRQLEPEVVHASNFYVNFVGYFGAFGTGARAVGSIRNDFVFSKQECGPVVGRLSALWPRSQVSNSAAALESARRSRSFFVPRHLHVVRNALDMARFPSAPVPPNGVTSIVGVGYLLPAKRWDRLLAVAATLKRRGFDYVLRIAGDGPLLSALTQQACDLDVSDRVTFLGHVSDIPRLMEDATFVVHTADNEGCPNAVMEAMAWDAP